MRLDLDIWYGGVGGGFRSGLGRGAGGGPEPRGEEECRRCQGEEEIWPLGWALWLYEEEARAEVDLRRGHGGYLHLASAEVKAEGRRVKNRD